MNGFGAPFIFIRIYNKRYAWLRVAWPGGCFCPNVFPSASFVYLKTADGPENNIQVGISITVVIRQRLIGLIAGWRTCLACHSFVFTFVQNLTPNGLAAFFLNVKLIFWMS
jgi:hypothetical protein